ncbi:PREDICTED: uncharacterized protein LOC109208240 [Nicotiana attenuata]|uniref:uncharacterized protein LOC109208240 n=1 Tax=Nicotiana attenuata TaxID=49451 RepID=UPI000904EB9A|nr:PREDICTED: uncharacterized protein LOC109208240 [Nicotiana attenuata]
MLREFVSRFQMEQMELLPVSDDWAVQAFTQGLNEQSSVASKQLKENLIEYPAKTWADVHNRYQRKISVEDNQLGAPLGLVYPSRFVIKEQRFVEREPRPKKERYRPYVEDRRNAPKRNIPCGNRRTDRSQNSQGLMNKTGFDRHTGPIEAPRLSEYNFNIDVSHIMSATGKIKDTRWPRPILLDPSQRNPNLVCKYHGTHGHKTEDCRQLQEEEERARRTTARHPHDHRRDRSPAGTHYQANRNIHHQRKADSKLHSRGGSHVQRRRQRALVSAS